MWRQQPYGVRSTEQITVPTHKLPEHGMKGLDFKVLAAFARQVLTGCLHDACHCGAGETKEKHLLGGLKPF
jgi:hypothetical protein